MSETAIQVIGYIASGIIVLSLCFPTHTRKSTLMLRIINLIGSAFFMAFGLLTPNNIPTAVLNGATIVIDIVQIVLLYVKKPQKDNTDKNADNSSAIEVENQTAESEE